MLMKTYTVNELINELKKYPMDMEVYYTTKYALIPLEVVPIGDRCISIDMHRDEKHKYSKGD